MNSDLYGRVLERVFDTIMTFQHVEKIERMKRGASPWLLRFLSGYIQTIGPAGTGPCIGDLLKSHWAKHGCKRAADTNAAPSARIDPSSMISNRANAVEAPRRSHEPAVQPLPSKFHSTGHSDDCLRDLGRRIKKEFVEVLQQMSSATYTNSCPLHTPTLDDATPTILGQGISGFPAMRTFIRDPVPETPLPILEKPVLSPSSVSEPGKSTPLATQAYAAKNPFTSNAKDSEPSLLHRLRCMTQLEAAASTPALAADDVAAQLIAVEKSINDSPTIPSQTPKQSTVGAICGRTKTSKSLVVLNFPSNIGDDELLKEFTAKGFQVESVCGKSSTANLKLDGNKSAFAFVNCKSTAAASSLKQACDAGQIVFSGKNKDWIMKADWAKKSIGKGKSAAKKHRGTTSS